MRISEWSSDVCSSDLADAARPDTETTVPAQAPAADASATAPVAADAAAGASDQTADIGIAEVIVTARRKSESLQDVPQTVNAVSNETLQKLNIQKFEDEIGRASCRERVCQYV